MRRIISIMCAAALVMLAACQKEESTASKVALTATLEQQVDNGATKTALNPTNNVIWSVGDQIKVNTTNGLETLTLTAGQGTTMGSFGSTEGDNPNYAIYPASACTSLDGSTFTFTLPATQTYAENSFGPGANVAVAAISGSNMVFKNVCGVLKLQLKGSMKVSKIELTGKSGEKLSGAFTVDAAASPFVGAVKEGEPTEPDKKVTLDCSHFGETSKGAADGGVQLDFETATIFDIVVPVSAFAGGFKAKITDVAGETICKTLETTEGNTIARSTITRMPRIAVSLLPEDFTGVEYVQSSGNELIITNLSGNARWIVEVQAEIVKGNSQCVLASSPSAAPGTWFGEFTTTRHWDVVSGGTTIAPTVKTVADLVFNNTGVIGTIGGTPVSRNVSATQQQWTLMNCSNKAYGYSGKLWFAKCFDEVGCCSMYLIPAKVKKTEGVTDVKGENAPQGTVGMYDVVNDKFYTNDGEGSFIAGPELED